MRPRIGGHVSAAGGLHKSIENAEKIGAECIQIFGGSPRMWRSKLPAEAEVKKYQELLKKSKVGAVYLHASYLVNLASAKDYNREQSIASLIDHLQIAETIGANGLIFHLGSSGDEPDKKVALRKTVTAMQEILKVVPGKSFLIMENSAGGGEKLGLKFSEIGEILHQVGAGSSRLDAKRVKVCLDTAHIFEAGGIDEYSAPKIKAMFDEFALEIGLDNLVALHINDSKTAFNSHHDRHENLGEGFIGLAGFKNLAKDQRLWDKDWLLEVPGFDNQGPDKENMAILRGLFKQ